MRSLFLLLILSPLMTIGQKDVVRFKAVIKNRNSDTISISGNGVDRKIPVNKKGEFVDKFHAPEGIYQYYDGTDYKKLFLKNGFDLVMTTDGEMFDEELKYTGTGAAENNYLAQKSLDMEVIEKFVVDSGGKPDMQKMTAMMMEFTSKYRELLKPLDPGLKNALDKEAEEASARQKIKKQERDEAMKKVEALKGTAAPDFEYENFKGGKTKLSDLKGKYVYIDTWATWCAPCRAQIPALKEIEKEFHDKNIEFVSVSIDKPKDRGKWLKMVTDQQLGGVQLMADKDWDSDWVKALGIKSIPRFILVSPDGTLLETNAPRPSDPDLREQLAKLLN